jgi:hypothetical protein
MRLAERKNTESRRTCITQIRTDFGVGHSDRSNERERSANGVKRNALHVKASGRHCMSNAEHTADEEGFAASPNALASRRNVQLSLSHLAVFVRIPPATESRLLGRGHIRLLKLANSHSGGKCHFV